MISFIYPIILEFFLQNFIFYLGPSTFNENETIAKYEIMDGAPVRGESIPIRVFLAGYDLTPTMRDVNKRFSVRYFLNLVLMDEEDRRYFKQQVSSSFNLIFVQYVSLKQLNDYSVPHSDFSIYLRVSIFVSASLSTCTVCI